MSIRGRRILFVDDDDDLRYLVNIWLSSQSYEVTTAQNGAAALELAEKSPPNLILLDMRMPVMDGWAFARVYRQRPGPHAPIVVLTAARDAAERAADIAADGYLGKPFDLNELLTVVGQHTAQR